MGCYPVLELEPNPVFPLSAKAGLALAEERVVKLSQKCLYSLGIVRSTMDVSHLESNVTLDAGVVRLDIDAGKASRKKM